MKYSLNFTIPQGPTGPAGITTMEAYGGKYNDSAQQLDVDTKATLQVPLPQNMPNKNVSYSDK